MSAHLSKSADLPQLSSKWRTADAGSDQSDRSDGKRLALSGSGPAEAIRSFRRRLIAEASRDITLLQGQCSSLLNEQEKKRDQLQKELDNEVTSESKQANDAHEAFLGGLRRSIGPESEVYKDAAARVDDAGKDLRKVQSDVGSRPLRIQFGWLYYVIMGVLALAEAPINRAAFELTFREEPLYSLLLAMAVGIVLIFFAHLIGLILRRWPDKPRVSQIIVRVGGMAVLLSIAGLGIYFIARMRQTFLRLTSAESEGFGSRLQEALQGGPGQVVAIVTDAPFSVGDFAFIAINLLLFVFGIAASFLRHDPHPDYEKAVKAKTRADKVKLKLDTRYQGKVADEVSRFEVRKRGFETRINSLQTSLTAIANDEDMVRSHLVRATGLAAQTVHSRCGTFVDAFNDAKSKETPTMETPEFGALLADLTNQTKLGSEAVANAS
ncbi:hypothetical protein EAH89_18800 [Roseomonas nepalensis]|uniref:Uncharacterized protein n=1 Tax=Muricoccus nepalensis TaxID=1854500 RepID=A0A502FSB3_9PROT|nr:hypothetical protein [Roseomonas nepalensis]TPG52289.1 hypothetical protein EAH89_18800 [Roseomonas nepalensis]